ncbi:RluA family pseudouridine synthase [soil metagenome]
MADPTEITVPPDSTQLGDRLDRFLAASLPGLSRSRLAALIKEGHVLVDGSPAKAKRPVVAHMRILIAVPSPVASDARPQDLPIRLLYEDDDLAVIDKGSGMVVHPASGNLDGTLVNALLHRFGALSEIGGVVRPGIVHRLDKDTSGCLVVARNDFTHEHLSSQFSARTVSKQYLAVVAGIPDTASGTIETNIARNPQNRQKMAVVNPPAGKVAVTKFRVAGTLQKSALVVCDLLTGRTHQIRVHLKHLGHPILGDPIYAKGITKHPVGRLMLHAWKLAFEHPRTGQRLTLEAPPPDAFLPWLAASDLPS